MKAEELLNLENKVRYLPWWEFLPLIRETAAKHKMSSDDLCKQVIHLALELGHVQPIRQVESIDLYEGLDA